MLLPQLVKSNKVEICSLEELIPKEAFLSMDFPAYHTFTPRPLSLEH